MIRIRDTRIDDLVRALKIQKPEGSYDEVRLKKEQEMLLRVNKKQIISIASEIATSLIEKIDWRTDRYYTSFFIDGGLSYFDS